MILNLRGSYFAITNPLGILLRWLNPYTHSKTILINGYETEVCWTRRADKELLLRTQPLLAELQLYFSCVVQKRVLFHTESEHEYVPVGDKLKICFRPVEALSCAPEQFAEHHPVKQQLTSKSAIRMHPKRCLIDYTKHQWQGEFSI